MKTDTKLHLFFSGKYVLGITLSFFFMTPVLAQNGKSQPNVHIEVKRELDNNGNVIRYDSTYSWTWSGSDSSSNFLNDSMFFQFFPKSDLSFENPFSISGNDSAFFNYFGFSENAFDLNQQMEQMMKNQEEILEQHQAIIKQLQQSKPTTPAPDIREQNQQPAVKKGTPEEKPKQQGIDL